jgi:hypothetical protein
VLVKVDRLVLKADGHRRRRKNPLSDADTQQKSGGMAVFPTR